MMKRTMPTNTKMKKIPNIENIESKGENMLEPPNYYGRTQIFKKFEKLVASLQSHPRKAVRSALAKGVYLTCIIPCVGDLTIT